MMARKGRKRSRSLPPDLLSNLPDNVIDVILIRLPSRDAVRTSILTKKWRYHWCRLTELTLDSSLWEKREDLMHPTLKFTKIIDQLLTVHEGPITKFTLDIASLIKSCPNIDNFIYFLSRNDIQHLVLCFPWDKIYNLPSSLFTCSQLRHLTLHNCSIHHPSSFHGFDRLTSLELCRVVISTELLESLISRCPLLEQLVLKFSEYSSIVEINAPMLRSFTFSGNICRIYLKNVPLLANLSLFGEGYMVEDFDFAKFFESCSVLEHLLLSYYLDVEFDEEPDEVPIRLPYDLNHVKRSYFRISLEESYMMSWFCCLIRSFPHLEYLAIEDLSEEDNGEVESLELECFSDVTFNHLREVKLVCFMLLTPQMQLIELLLAKSPLLVRMLIYPNPNSEEPLTKAGVLNELSNFWHASPKAEIVYME